MERWADTELQSGAFERLHTQMAHASQALKLGNCYLHEPCAPPKDMPGKIICYIDERKLLVNMESLRDLGNKSWNGGSHFSTSYA